MSVQNRLNIDNTPFVLFEYPAVREDDAVLLQDAGRTTPLAPYTLMARNATTRKWVPFTDIAATDGTGLPRGIYMGPEIAAADIVAGDVIDLPIILTGIRFDSEKLVIENSLSLNTILAPTTLAAETISDFLIGRTLIPELTETSSRFENA